MGQSWDIDMLTEVSTHHGYGKGLITRRLHSSHILVLHMSCESD